MLRLRPVYQFYWRFCQFRPLSSDALLGQLRNCKDEDEILDLVGKNKAKLSEKHVDYAIKVLWQFRKGQTTQKRSTDYVRDHPQFLTLQILAENKIELMGNDALVNILYVMLRFGVEAHDSLIEELVVEAWRRVERFNFMALSKFSTCLCDQQLHVSPLMGKVADIVSRNLDSVQDLRALSVLMVSISSVISPDFRGRLVNKAEFLFDTKDSSLLNASRRILQFLRNVRYNYRPLIEKCSNVFLNNAICLNLDSINVILGLYQSLQINNCAFRLVAKEKLIQMMDLFNNPACFVKLFTALGPMAGLQERERLKATLLLMAEELTSQQALAVVVTMEEMNSKNSRLIKKIASVLYKYLDIYTPAELAKVTKALVLLRFHSSELFTKLRELLLRHLRVSIVTREIAMLVRVIAMLPYPHLDKAGISRVDAALPQCNLSDLSVFALSIAKWDCHSLSYLEDFSGTNTMLLQKLNICGFQRVQKANNLDLLWEELEYVNGSWFNETLLEETMVAWQRLMDQIMYTNAPDTAFFIARTNYLSAPLLDRIASVTVQDIDKIYPSALYLIILPFSILNYDPPQSEEFYETCIQCLNSHLSLFEPHILVLLAFSLALAEYFPEKLIKAIFNIDFLAKLDSHMEILSPSFNMKIWLCLTELNRAVCLECPEFQIPWFHDHYCQQQCLHDNGDVSAGQQKIYKMLGEVLGGISYTRASVFTPYYHRIDFECILDKRKKPLPYQSQHITCGGVTSLHMGIDTYLVGASLPPGAQRVALEFLGPKAFCRNKQHLKGKWAMKKRHLEILGYRVIQIPHFVWNSMELSTKDAWMKYLREHIFAEDNL
ncbi:FAST kinase domain-containing protein 1, mitochondrial [Tachyglossus aculeatus]|uniref:FAST kinase domain-containing protein 1, mitochondrial n=1 Tax=Tachyglossus aculeatus TaxID=9261 RepID=UPI0018F4E7D7|nr:FAST kinase domain-containing protein 1, mitochondrial [Tachyglossus aculeatus]